MVSNNTSFKPSYKEKGPNSGSSLTGLKSRCWQGWILLETPRENLFLTSCSFWEAIGIPWLMSTPLPHSSCHRIALLLPARLSTSSYRIPVMASGHPNTPGHSPHLESLHLMPFANSLLPRQVSTRSGSGLVSGHLREGIPQPVTERASRGEVTSRPVHLRKKPHWLLGKE